jgi:DNA-binding LacI/PurR family transcriptional regulator
MPDPSFMENRISRDLVARIAAELAHLADNQSKPIQLPPERKLAEKFSTSRRAIRLAIDQLVNRGLIARKQGSGNYLLPKGLSVSSVFLIIPSNIKPDDPFYSILISQFTLYAREHEIQLLPVRMDRNVLLNKDMPGILLAKLPPEQLDEVTSTLKNVISIAELETDRCCQIYYDDLSIGRQAAHQLSTRGHRNILLLAGPDDFASARDRLTGFREVSQTQNLNLTVRQGSMNWRGGYDLMTDYLQNTNAVSRATAVFAANDWMAAGALQAIIQKGLCVPTDLALLGCDDIPLAADLEPPLATFRLDVARWVEQTFVALEQIWRLELPGKIVLPAAFIDRPSIGGPKNV